MEPDYENYALVERLEVKEHIDKRLYPKRYKRLLDEISLREQNSEGEAEPQTPSKSDRIVILKVIIALCVIFFSWNLSNAFQTGLIKSRGGHEYYLATNPGGFYFIVALHVFFLVFSVYFIMMGSSKKST